MSVMLRLAAFSLFGVLVGSFSVRAEAEQRKTGQKEAGQAEGREQKVELCEARPRFWNRIAAEKSGRYCGLLRKAQANLWTSPKRAEQYAEGALLLLPQGVLAHLIVAQSLLLQGQPEKSHRLFSVWSQQAPEALRGTVIRVSAARAALLSGHYEDAVAQYRGAILGWDWRLSSRERARVLVEAATAVAYAGPSRGREARHYLALALELEAPLLVEVIQAAQALSWLREGNDAEAAFALDSEADAWTLPWIFERSAPRRGKPNEVLPVLPPGEVDALIAAVAQVVEPDTAPEAWEAFRQSAGKHCPVHLRSGKGKSLE